MCGDTFPEFMYFKENFVRLIVSVNGQPTVSSLSLIDLTVTSNIPTLEHPSEGEIWLFSSQLVTLAITGQIVDFST